MRIAYAPMPWNDVTIVRVVQETPLDRTFHLALAEGAAFEGTPGQYVVLRDPAESPERDWYFSLSGVPDPDGRVRITVRGRGDAVQRIYDAPVGTRWRLQPPAGSFHIEGPAEESVVLLAAGSGVTPFRAFVEQRLTEDGTDPVWLFHCAKHGEELLFRAEFQAWSDAADAFTYVPSVTGTDDPAWAGRRGRLDAAALDPALPAPERARVYACGPGPFVEAALETAAALGVPEERRLREAW